MSFLAGSENVQIAQEIPSFAANCRGKRSDGQPSSPGKVEE